MPTNTHFNDNRGDSLKTMAMYFKLLSPAPDSLIETTSLKVNIVENQMTCRFAVDTRLRGRIRAVCMDGRRNNAFLMSIEADLGDVVKAYLEKPRPPSAPKLTHVRVEGSTTPKTVVVTTEGRCAFRFGVKQEVEVTQVVAPYPPG